MNKRRLFRCGSVVIACFVFFRLAWLVMPNICNIWELQVSDQLLRLAYSLQGKREISPDIVYVDLDDSSISSLKYTKSDPLLYAELIRILSQSGARIILLDMIFPNCTQDGCSSLVDEAQNAGNVHLAAIMSTESLGVGQGIITRPVGDNLYLDISPPKDAELTSAQVLMTSFTELNEVAAGLGHMNCSPDRDGVYRRIPMFLKTSSGLVPSMALRTALGYLDHPVQQVRFDSCCTLVLEEALLPDGTIRDISIPLNIKGENRISFSGMWEDTFAHYSFETILKAGETPAGLLDLINELEDSLVIISDVSTGGRDFGAVPLAAWYPLSGVHGNLINSILTDDFISELDFYQRLYLDFTLIGLLTLIACITRGSRFAMLATSFFFGALAVSVAAFLEYRLILPVVRPTLSLVAAVLSLMLLQFLDEQKEKQYIRSTLTHYFAPSLMEKILYDPDLIKGVSKKNLTVLFSDIVGFTSWSSTRDAGEIHLTLNRYFEEMAEIVFIHEGTIDKYIGDGLMVFFGDPTPTPDHALQAVRAGIEMQKRTKALKKEWGSSGGMEIEIRVGIHTGEVVVGNMGSQSRMDYTVIGSNVNLAQRLESNCPPGGVLISEEVKNQLRGKIGVSSAGEITVKGFSEPVAVYTVNQ